MIPTNDPERYEAMQCRIMRQWREEELRARMEVLMFDEPEVKDVGSDQGEEA